MDTNRLRQHALQSGEENRVQVNQRMLIDKMLARYSSDFVVCRELIQNADDARATSFEFDLFCSSTNFIEEIRAKNNGLVFSETDWKRIAAIAEGNTNVESVGQFGVGFFSVFSFAEEPMIISGNEYMAFVWRDDQSLTTFRHQLPVEEQQLDQTSIILKMRSNYLLKTDVGKSPKKKNDELVPILDLQQLKIYFTKVLSFTKHLNDLKIRINNKIVFHVTKRRRALHHSKCQLEKNSIHNLLRMNSFVQTEQIFAIENGPSISLHHISVDATVTLPTQLDQQIQRILKKNLPPKIDIQLLYSPKHIGGRSAENEILQTLIPMKTRDKDSIPAGLIFIGLGTHQTTGIGMHVYSHLIPTIERENLDLQDPFISKWNTEILSSVGQIVRFLYDQIVMEKSDDYSSIFSCFSFQPSVPNGQIGSILLDGFFSSNKKLLVPVRRSPQDSKIVFVPSTDAYLPTSKFLQTFVSLPLVPHHLTSNGLFQSLKDRNLISEVTSELIESNIETTILLAEQFVAFLHWLSSTSNQHDKTFVKRLLSIVRFRQTENSPIITLERLKSYDNFHLPSNIPLASHVLPSNIALHLSREQLQKQLSLSPWTLKEFLHFFLLKNQQNLFTDGETSEILLTIISKHSGQLTKAEWNKFQSNLANLPCIPTTDGMKIPHESFIPSSIVSSDVPLIKLKISDDENDENVDRISIEFLKRLGCRTINVQSFVQSRSTSKTDENVETMKMLIQHLIDEREQMSEGDFNALKKSECLRGTTLNGNKSSQKKYVPTDLHFPSVAVRLNWKDLPILDWKDIDVRSREFVFLKELGVREVPDLNRLIDRIIDEHQQQNTDEYSLPKSLIFFAENFQEFYAKLWKTAKIKRAFLPSVSPTQNIVLSSVDQVFTESSPLCPTLLKEVAELFDEHCNLTSIGIKDRPTLNVAFDILMEKRDELLNIDSAREIFSYLNQLDGLSRPLIERISKNAFIPLEGSDEFLKVSQVFIRSDGNSSSRLRKLDVIVLTSSDENDDENPRRRKRTSKKKSSTNKKTKIVTACPTEIDETDKTGLIDYVDFGPDGNSFLLGIGVLHHPSAAVLADLLIDRQANFFADCNAEDLKRKLLAYTSCLKQLAVAAQTTNELQSANLVKRLKSHPWCLAYQTVERRSNGEKQRIFRIVSPNEIYLDDDHQCAIDLRPLLPPEEPELTKLYEKFGAKWLSECVKRNLVHRGKVATSDRGNKLKELIQHRLDMLFVNNRGEKMENLDDKNVEMLRNQLFVFEVEGIQCQLTFEKRTIVLESTDSSSCALEHDKNKVHLFIQKYIRELDYIDIASELARFVFKKPLDTIVHAISDKLASPLETLKRRGVPVDRLLQKSHQHIVLPMRKDIRPTTTTTIENHESHVEINGYVEDFRRHQMKDENKYFSSLIKGRAHTQSKFIQQEHVKDDIDHSCEAVPSADMTRYKETFHSIPLYVERNVRVNEQMIDQAKQLAWILTGLARDVFHIPFETLHLYRDIHGARIAFNDRRALFFNLRYYEQVFADQIRPHLQCDKPSLPIHHTIVNFYFLLTCHELAHNLESAHNSNFVNHLETIAVKYMTDKDLFLQTFTMKNYLNN